MLIPERLNFVNGVVDLGVLALNISRETLPQNKILRVIKKTLAKNCLETFAETAKEKVDYTKFPEEFGKCLNLCGWCCRDMTQCAWPRMWSTRPMKCPRSLQTAWGAAAQAEASGSGTTVASNASQGRLHKRVSGKRKGERERKERTRKVKEKETRKRG